MEEHKGTAILALCWDREIVSNLVQYKGRQAGGKLERHACADMKTLKEALMAAILASNSGKAVVLDAIVEVTVNDLPYAGPEKDVYGCKQLIVDLSQRFKIVLNAPAVSGFLKRDSSSPVQYGHPFRPGKVGQAFYPLVA